MTDATPQEAPVAEAVAPDTQVPDAKPAKTVAEAVSGMSLQDINFVIQNEHAKLATLGGEMSMLKQIVDNWVEQINDHTTTLNAMSAEAKKRHERLLEVQEEFKRRSEAEAASTCEVVSEA